MTIHRQFSLPRQILSKWVCNEIYLLIFIGVNSFAQSSQHTGQLDENFDFKENNQELYNDDYMNRQPVGTLPASAMYEDGMLQTKAPEIASRLSIISDHRVSPLKMLNDKYYTRHLVNPHAKKQDFKVSICLFLWLMNPRQSWFATT